MKTEIILIIFFALVLCGCRENIKNANVDISSSDHKSNSLKAEEVPVQIITAKDTFYSPSVLIPSRSSRFFEDIHFLAGRHQLKTIKFPCVEINDSGNVKIVSYHYDKKTHNTYVYHKVNNYWIAKHFYEGDTCRYWYIYELVLSDRRVSFLYSDKEATRFSDLTIEYSDRETIYKPKRGLFISPDIRNVSTVINDYNYKHETILREKGNLTQIQNLRTLKNGTVEIDNSTCYLKGLKNYSLTWWIAFGMIMNKEASCE